MQGYPSITITHYHHPQSVLDIVDFVVTRMLDYLEAVQELMKK